MPKTKHAEQIHADKHREPGESFEESCNRVAAALSDDESHYRALRETLSEQRVLCGGRVHRGAGSTNAVTQHNCFLSATIEDSMVAGNNSILGVFSQAMATMRMGGGVGYDFSTLRPRGDTVKKLSALSSGPVSFMEIFDTGCKTIASAGNRRGAQMGVLRVDHPDISEFIRAKQKEGSLTAFNISVALTAEFMQALEYGKPFNLQFRNKIYSTIDPGPLWEKVMRSNYDWGEPGVLFIDRINEWNNLWYCEKIAATNPCGEQPLGPHASCLLGSLNLVKYILPEQGAFNYAQMEEDLFHFYRALDNVIDRSKYPLYEQEKRAKETRRIGIGVTGAANALEALGMKYGTPEFIASLETILCSIRDCAYRFSVERAKDKGAFPQYSKDYLDGLFIRTLPADLQADIEKHGIRNSHLLSIAPTGSISLGADNVSSGIEPPYALTQQRTIKTFDGEEIIELKDWAFREYGIRGRTSEEVTPEQHIDVLCAAQKYVDSAVSKTCNVPENVGWDDFKNLYWRAYKGGAKGCTTFRANCKRVGILKKVDESDSSCEIDLETGRTSCE